jgi:nucleotide-binding universal stress UspA family protein
MHMTETHMRDAPVLVPLDGSPLAERALPYAKALAAAFRAPLVLAMAIDSPRTTFRLRPGAADDEAMHQLRAGADAYLRGIVEKSGVAAEPVLREGEAAAEITALAAERGARMIVMTTHGRSGPSRWLRGSTAGGVMRDAPVPVVAIGPEVPAAAGDVAISRIAVPLDGSPAGELALAPAHELAQACGAKVVLVRAMSPAAMVYPEFMPPHYVTDLDREIDASVNAYLAEQAKEIDAAETRALLGPTADVLIDFVSKAEIDMVVMTTHGRSGIARAALGSVADRMLQCAAPVMFVRA